MIEASKGAWTPGPWRAEAYNLRMGSLISYGDLSKGQTVAISFGQLDAEQGKANARLIAAAPALYEALEAMLELSYWDTEESKEDAKNKARAALALANPAREVR